MIPPPPRQATSQNMRLSKRITHASRSVPLWTTLENHTSSLIQVTFPLSECPCQKQDILIENINFPIACDKSHEYSLFILSFSKSEPDINVATVLLNTIPLSEINFFGKRPCINVFREILKSPNFPPFYYEERRYTSTGKGLFLIYRYTNMYVIVTPILLAYANTDKTVIRPLSTSDKTWGVQSLASIRAVNANLEYAVFLRTM